MIQSINIITFVSFCFLSMTSVSGYKRQAEWVSIGGKNYDFNLAPLTQPEASARCIRFGGKLFEPRDAKTNRDVFIQAGAKLNGNTKLWIGISDVGTETEFTYLSDGARVNFVCEGSDEASGCWRALQPIPQVAAGTDAGGQIGAATQNLDCVFGSSDQDGKWQTSNCVLNVVDQPIKDADATTAGIAADTYDFVAPLAAKFGSICEKDAAPTTQAPNTPTPPETSDSTCLKSGIAVMIGMLFFCYQ